MILSIYSVQQVIANSPKMSHFSCAICLNVFDAGGSGDIVSIKCGHVFHGNCLNLWFLSQKNRLIFKSCPTCRHIVLTSHMRRLYLSESASANAVEIEPNANIPDDEKAIENGQVILTSEDAIEATDDDMMEESDDDEPSQAVVYQRPSAEVDRRNPTNRAAEYLRTSRTFLNGMRTRLDVLNGILGTIMHEMEVDENRLEAVDQVLVNLADQMNS